MSERNINILEFADKFIKPISKCFSENEKAGVVLSTFLSIKKTNNEIRNRLDLFTINSPEILKQIIEN